MSVGENWAVVDEPYWFVILRAAAKHGTSIKRTFTALDLDQIEAESRRRMAQDQAVAPYPAAVAAYAESLLELLDHWRAGTATPLEIAMAYWFLADAVEWRARRYDELPGEPVSPTWFQLLAHMAMVVLRPWSDERQQSPAPVEMTVREAAMRMNVSIGHMRRLIRTGRLPSVKRGGRRMVLLSATPTWLATLRAAAARARSKNPLPITLDELNFHEKGTREIVDINNEILPYPPDIAAYTESLFTLMDDYRNGTATPVQLADAMIGFGPAVEWFASTYEGVVVEGAGEVIEHFHDLFDRMAMEMLGD